LYFQNAQKDEQETVENQITMTNKSQNIQTVANPTQESFHGQITNDVISGRPRHYCTTNIHIRKHAFFFNLYFLIIHPTFSLISVILERGNKLRNAMVVSALKSDMNSAPALKDNPLPLPKSNIEPPAKSVIPKKRLFLFSSSTYNVKIQSKCPPGVCRFPPVSGTFLQDILYADSALQHTDDVSLISDCGFDCAGDMEKRAVDLLLGRCVYAFTSKGLKI